MYSHLKIEHDGLLSGEDAVQPDDIRAKVLQLYPIDQQECLIDSLEEFEDACYRQGEFKPFGEKITEFSFGMF